MAEKVNTGSDVVTDSNVDVKYRQWCRCRTCETEISFLLLQ